MSIFFEPWLLYQHPMVRQLAFAIACPNLLQKTPTELQLKQAFSWHESDFWRKQYMHYQSRLIELDHHPDELLQFFKPLKSTRLGLRFEYFIWFWLLDSDYHPYQVLGHSLQMIEAKNTLGELDFLLYNKHSQRVEHWEVALKYYLGEADLSLRHWYGLNRDDTLLKKLHHFSHQQFKFDQVNGHQIERRFAIVKGQLYLPTYHQHNVQPDWINPDRRLGRWGHQVYSNSEQYYRLNRFEWLCVDAEQNTLENKWWSNGLYYNVQKKDYYMYRQASIVHTCVT